MRERQFVVLARPGDVMSADVLVAFLAAHEISARVDGVDPLGIALGGCVRVVIAEGDLRRARWLLDSAEASDVEAWLLATGEFDPSAARSAFATRIAPEERQTRRLALRVGAIGLVGFFAALALIAR